MDPTTLLAPVNAMGYPAPWWFLVFFKVLGFTLHMVPMNLWYAGILVAMLLKLSPGPQARRASARLMGQMPFIVAWGVNLGIVPLLFIQVAYYRVFYSATILMAWWWLSIIAMLCLAYYSVYIYAIGLRREVEQKRSMPGWQAATGWLAAMLFIAIGFVFHNAWTLMANMAGWEALASKHNLDGALLGTALNTGDPSMWGRMVMFFGLALTTTAAWFAFDAHVLAGRERVEYRRWVPGFSLILYVIGVAVSGAGSLYYLNFGPAGMKELLLSPAMLPLTIATAALPLLPLLLILLQRGRLSTALAWFTGISQFLVLGLHAIVRQIVQNWQLRPYLDVTSETVKLQLSPLVMFLLAFLLTVGALAWMILKLVAVHRRELAAHK